MSIIEKAASRLEKSAATSAHQVLPEQASALAKEAAGLSSNAEATATPVTDTAGRNSSRKATIDLEQLKALGMVTPETGRTAISEEFRLIKRPLLEKAFNKLKPTRHGNLIMVSSSLPGEGKTFCAVNLAISIAMELDNTVLLVDADVARPAVPRYLQIREDDTDSKVGLMDVLLNDKLDLADAMMRTNIENLTLLCAGTSHQRATELLASQSMISLLDEISTRYPDRIVIFDSPPLLITTEARVLAKQMGQIVLVVEAEVTTQNAVKEVLRQLKSNSNVNLVYNKAKAFSNEGYYGSYYG